MLDDRAISHVQEILDLVTLRERPNLKILDHDSSLTYDHFDLLIDRFDYWIGEQWIDEGLAKFLTIVLRAMQKKAFRIADTSERLLTGKYKTYNKYEGL